MRNSYIVKLLVITLMCYSFTMPSFGFDFSDDIIIAGVETAGVGSAAGETYLACSTAKCNELKESLTPINEGLTIYNKELVRLINQLADPEIVDMLKEAKKQKNALNKADEKDNICIEKEKYSKLITQIIDKATLNSSHITQINNVLALQVDMRTKILGQLKGAIDFDKVKQQGIHLEGTEEE